MLATRSARFCMAMACWMMLGLPVAAGAEAPTDAADDPFVELVIPLEAGRYYRLRDLCAQCNDKLGAEFDLESIGNRTVELGSAERMALVWLEAINPAAGMLEVRLEAERVVLRIANGEHPEVRRRVRAWVELVAGVPLTQWPADKGLHLPERLDAQRVTAILIHGLESSAVSLDALAAALEEAGVQVLRFDYPCRGSIAMAGDRLREELLALEQSHPQLRLSIVAHSMGGLVARHALESPGTAPVRVANLVTLGTPHQGSALANQYLLLNLFLLATRRIEGRTDWQTDLMEGMGAAGADLRPQSRFLRELNGRPRVVATRYHCAAGTIGCFTAEQQRQMHADLIQQFNEDWAWLPVRGGILSLVDAEELRTGSGDGVVSVRSALAPAAESRHEFAVSHAGLVRGEDEPHREIVRWIVGIVGKP